MSGTMALLVGLLAAKTGKTDTQVLALAKDKIDAQNLEIRIKTAQTAQLQVSQQNE